MRIYRLFSIKENFLKNCEQENSKKMSAFFQLENLFKNLEIKNIYVKKDHINSILLDQEAIDKIKLYSKIKFNIVPDEIGLISDSIEYDKNKFNKLKVNNPDDVLSIIKEHMDQDHIKKLKRVKKDQQKSSVIKKELMRSRINTDFDKDFLNKKVVSIDFEYFNLDVYEIGVATLENGKLNYNHYLIEENFINKKTKPDKQFMFNFGESEIIPEIMISSIISNHLDNVDYLLSHGYSNDYLILKKYGLDLEKEEKLQITDTVLYYQKHFNKEQGNALNLKAMLNIFNIESKILHNAGNDAAYTLELMLEMHNRIKAPTTQLKFKNN